MTVTVTDTIDRNIFSDSSVGMHSAITANETISGDIFTGTSVTQFPGADEGIFDDTFDSTFE